MISRTAAYVAFYRALENGERRREPLFRDPFAERFLPRGLRWAAAMARVPLLRGALEQYADLRAPGARSSAICRTRFIDDVVGRALSDADVRQLVVLGAGFDCRAHRLAGLSGVRVFEVDRSATQAIKRAQIDAAGAELEARRDVEYVDVDFLHDDVADRLAARGWDRDRRSAFIWEGVSNYLSEAAVAKILSMVGASAPGGWLVFTYIHRGVLDGSVRFPGADRMLRSVRTLGEPWTFGIDPKDLPEYLQRFGLTLEDDLGADQYRERYGWKGRMGYGFYRIAVARVASAPTY